MHCLWLVVSVYPGMYVCCIVVDGITALKQLAEDILTKFHIGLELKKLHKHKFY